MSDLPESLKQKIQQGYRQFLEHYELKPRLGQRQMIAAVANSLGGLLPDSDADHEARQDSGICVVEAGTGTGKTIAYLLSVLPVAEQLGKQVVIATGTVALQEQLINKDIPALLESTDWEYSFVIAKGRGRYLCPMRLDQCLNTVNQQESGQFLFEDEFTFNPERRVIKQYQQMSDALVEGSWDGDRDHWDAYISDIDWLPLTIDRRQCLNRNCRFIRECCFFNARDALEEADCMVVNHDLLMSDLALGGGVILPAPENVIYVIDEAHRLADKAINHFTASSRMETSIAWLQKMQKQVSAIEQQTHQEASLVEQLNRLSDPIEKATSLLVQAQPQLLALLETSLEQVDRNAAAQQYRFNNGDVGEGLREQASNIAMVFSLMVTRLDAVAEELQSLVSATHPAVPLVDLENALQLVGTWQSRAEAGLQLWNYFAKPDNKTGPPVARWLSYEESTGGNLDIQLFASPTHSGNILRERLFDTCCGTVLTSATLQMLNSFDEFIKRTGLADSTPCHKVQGAFDHALAGTLSIPDIGADGSDPSAHTQALIDQLPELLNGDGGVLVLFSSKRQMEEVYEGIGDKVQGQLLVQHSLPYNQLLEKHKSVIDEGDASIIFGLASFAEGVDLPGNYCTQVIIAKLPFAVPNDPVTATLAEWLEASGGNAFMQISLPEASLKLNQACGRLLRRETDRGEIVILDRRILTRRYGANLLNSLPPFSRI